MTVDEKIVLAANSDPIDETKRVEIKLVTWWDRLPWWQKTLIVTSGVVAVIGGVAIAVRRKR